MVTVPVATAVMTPNVAVAGGAGLTVPTAMLELCQVTAMGLPEASLTNSVTVSPTVRVGAGGKIDSGAVTPGFAALVQIQFPPGPDPMGPLSKYVPDPVAPPRSCIDRELSSH